MEKILSRLVLAAIAASLACKDARPAVTIPEAATPGPVATTIENQGLPLTEKRRRGQQLGSLDFETADLKELEVGGEYKVGKITVIADSLLKTLFLDPRQLLRQATMCGIDTIPERINLILPEQYFVPRRDGRLEELEGNISSDGRGTITVFVNMGLMSRRATDILNKEFQVEGVQRERAHKNLTSIVVNRQTIGLICSAVTASRLSRFGSNLSPAQVEEQINRAAGYRDTYADRILQGLELPFLIVLPNQPYDKI